MRGRYQESAARDLVPGILEDLEVGKARSTGSFCYNRRLGKIISREKSGVPGADHGNPQAQVSRFQATLLLAPPVFLFAFGF